MKKEHLRKRRKEATENDICDYSIQRNLYWDDLGRPPFTKEVCSQSTGGLTFSQAVKQLGHSGTSGSFIYDRIKKGGFEQRPLDLQILCWNCQWGKRRNYGFCKHHPEIDLRVESEYYEKIMVVKGIFTPTESAKIVLAAYELKQDSSPDKFLEKLEKIFLNKLREESETTRLIALTPKK